MSTVEPAPDTSHASQLPAARTPRATGPVPYLGILWAFLLLALGVGAVRDSLVVLDVIPGGSWTGQALSELDNQAPTDWMVALAVVAIIVGLLLISVALRPRSRSELAVNAHAGVFVTKAGVRRLAQAAALSVDGVDTVSVSASTRQVKVAATAVTDSSATEAGIAAAVNDALQGLERVPDVRVRVTGLGAPQ